MFTPTGDDFYHGRSGPLSIRQRTDEELTPSLLGFIEASVATGFKRVYDFNAAEQNGVGGCPVDVVDGVRQSTALAYLTAEVRQRRNLRIRGNVNVDRVLLEGTIAMGVVADLPVGQRLHDHPGFYNAYALAPEHARMTPAVGSLLWTASSEAVGDELDLHVTATHLLDGSASPTGAAIVLATAVVQPESRGTLTLASTNPKDAPIIDSNYLATGRDTRRMLEAVKLGRDIARHHVFAPFNAGEMIPATRSATTP